MLTKLPTKPDPKMTKLLQSLSATAPVPFIVLSYTISVSMKIRSKVKMGLK